MCRGKGDASCYAQYNYNYQIINACGPTVGIRNIKMVVFGALKWPLFSSFLKNDFHLPIHLILAVLGLRCCGHFSRVTADRATLVASPGLLAAVAPPAGEQGSRAPGVSSRGLWAQ